MRMLVVTTTSSEGLQRAEPHQNLSSLCLEGGWSLMRSMGFASPNTGKNPAQPEDRGSNPRERIQSGEVRNDSN